METPVSGATARARVAPTMELPTTAVVRTLPDASEAAPMEAIAAALYDPGRPLKSSVATTKVRARPARGAVAARGWGRAPARKAVGDWQARSRSPPRARNVTASSLPASCPPREQTFSRPQTGSRGTWRRRWALLLCVALPDPPRAARGPIGAIELTGGRARSGAVWKGTWCRCRTAATACGCCGSRLRPLSAAGARLSYSSAPRTLRRRRRTLHPASPPSSTGA